MKNVKREQLIAALLTCQTVKEAAQTVGMSESGVYRVLREDEEFQAEYNRRKSEMLDGVSTRLQVKLTEATETIIEIMNDKGTPSQTRLNAARTLFEYGLKLVEQRELVERLAALEQRISGENGR